MAGVPEDANSLHQAMVDDLKNRGLVHSPAVEAAFRAVPRHVFLPDDIPLARVYSDEPIVTRYDQRKQPISSSSQPAIMAVMLEMLALRAGQRVLEVGAGTGYNAALIAQIVGDDGFVVSIDIDQDLAIEANEHLHAAGFAQVRVLVGDGTLGCERYAPFDRIILTVGAGDIAPAWCDQLQPAGRLLLPLTLRCTPRVVAFEPAGARVMRSVGVTLGGFMPLRGSGAPKPHEHRLPGRHGLSVWTDQRVDVNMQQVEAALAAPTREYPTGVWVENLSNWSGWALWLELHEPAFALAFYEIQDGKRPYQQTPGLVEGGQVALVVPQGRRSSTDRARGVELRVRCYGESDALTVRLISCLRTWQAAGSPRLEDDLHIGVLPSAAQVKLPAHAIVIRKPHMQFVLEIDSPTR